MILIAAFAAVGSKVFKSVTAAGMDSECFQPHQILGDVRQYQQLAEQHEQRRLQLSHEAQQQQEHSVQQDGAAAGSLECIDPNTVHPDVWAAACLLGAKGTQLIKIYRELQDCRSVKRLSAAGCKQTGLSTHQAASPECVC